MTISYEKVSRKPVIFGRLTGVTVKEFQEVCQRVKPLWQKAIEEKKQCLGRPATLGSIENKVLALLIYYRTYITHEFIDAALYVKSNLRKYLPYNVAGKVFVFLVHQR